MTNLTERLRWLLADATPGPWRRKGNDVLDAEGGLIVSFTTAFRADATQKKRDKADPNLVAEAITALPDLLTTLETLTQENARLKTVSEDHFRNAQRLAGEVAKRDVENARLREAGWRDIESAPKDGRDALVGCWVINYDEPEKPPVWSAWETVFDGGPLGCDGTWGDEPTHWHDMPAPPPLPARKALGGGDEQ